MDTAEVDREAIRLPADGSIDAEWTIRSERPCAEVEWAFGGTAAGGVRR
jgi:hypothetical protein